jgi:hypothetical protein
MAGTKVPADVGDKLILQYWGKEPPPYKEVSPGWTPRVHRPTATKDPGCKRTRGDEGGPAEEQPNGKRGRW